METWSGFEFHRHVFEDMEAFVTCPNPGTANGQLLLKTHYWGAFPATEVALLEKGFHLCCIRNTNRWGTDDNLDRQARFVRWVQQEYGLCDKVVPVGMSCGGLIATKFTAKYPEMVECLYLDAPVVNYMSCPCGFGVGEVLGGGSAIPEILNALRWDDGELADLDFAAICLRLIRKRGGVRDEKTYAFLRRYGHSTADIREAYRRFAEEEEDY